MAWWMAHLRLGEAVLSDLPAREGFDEAMYYAGCVAPDCGRCVERPGQRAVYMPDRPATHWVDSNDKWDEPIHFERFYDQYLRVSQGDEPPRRAFYWGYYVHLLTDALWIELGMRAFIGRGGEWNRALRRRMKRDALAWEQGFYRAHPDYPPLQKLEGVHRLGFDPMGLPEALILSRLQGVRPAYEGERAEAQIIAPEEYERALDQMIHLARMVIRGK